MFYFIIFCKISRFRIDANKELQRIIIFGLNLYSMETTHFLRKKCFVSSLFNADKKAAILKGISHYDELYNISQSMQ